MLPTQLTSASFAGYPPEAQALATTHLALLRRCPLAFLPLLLRETIVYDWKFPAERRELDHQFIWLSNLAPAAFDNEMAAFTRLRLTNDPEKTDWVNKPAIFSEQLSAHLWATHQIDAFRAAAIDYVRNSAAPDEPLPSHRLGIAIVGQGVIDNRYRLFRKLRPLGVYYSRVQHPPGGAATLLDAAARRAAAHPAPYGHWYIDGGVPLKAAPGLLTTVSWNALTPARDAIQRSMQKTYEAGAWDPEAFRTTLSQSGLGNRADTPLSRFELSLFTEGSGTQVFSTTFAQWAAREALRRAQPMTMVVRFAPRQREQSMGELLNETRHAPALDPEGSLVDADMGAYYTWVNQQRLPGAASATFLAWFEDRHEAVAISPALRPGSTSDEPIDLAALIAQLT